MLKKGLTTFALFLSFLAYSQITILEKQPFQSGEIGEYDAIYQWGLITIRAGTVVFKVDSIYENGTAYYLFSSIGVSKKKYDWLYSIRDTFKSKVRIHDFQPISYQRHTFERSYWVDNHTDFMEEEGSIMLYLNNSEEGTRTKSLPYEKGILDLQTAVYFARMLNFKNATIGDGFEFNIIIDGQPYTIPITFEGKENIELQKNQAISCYKISTHVIEGTIFKSGQSINIWVKDDGSQVPVKVEAPIIIGNIRAELINLRVVGD